MLTNKMHTYAHDLKHRFARAQHLVCLSFVLLTAGCGSALIKNDPPTLADIDISGEKQEVRTQLRGKKTKKEVLEAYRNYVKTAPDSDLSRQQALSRLAGLELELINDKQAKEDPE